MGKWELVRLGDIGESFIGLTYKPENIVDDGIIVLRSGNIQNNAIDLSDIVRVDKTPNSKLLVIKGDILMCSRNGSVNLVGKSAIISNLPESMTFGAFMMIFRSKSNLYITHFFHSPYFKRQLTNSATTTINQITKSMLDNVVIPFPPLDEQKRIAKNLDLASKIVKGYKEQLAELDKLVHSVFYEMFSTLIEDQATYKPLTEVVKFIDYRGKTPEKSDTGIPLITAKNVKKNAFSLEPQEFIPQNTYEAVMTRGFPRINDVLFTTEAPLGNVCRIPNIFERFVVGQRLITMQPIGGVVTSEYLEFILSSKQFQNEMRKRSSGSTVKGIRSKELVQLYISVPPFHLQTHFASIVTEIEAQKAQIQQALTEAENLFNSLMQEYFE